ncbi:MAG TPA: ribosome silencing factor [Nitrospiraceae bacterium]
MRRNQIFPESKAKALAIAAASLVKKAEDVMILDVGKLTSVADYLVLCSGGSDRQVRAIADQIDDSLAQQRIHPLSIEGTSTSQWVLMDYGDVVVHIFRTDLRTHYALERLWGDAKQIRLPDNPPPPAVATTTPTRTRTRIRG